MPKRHTATVPAVQDKQCSHIACNDCGIYNLCHTVGGDVNLSLLDTLVKNRRTFKRGEFLYHIGEPFKAIYAIRSGSIKTSILTDDGRAQVTGFHISGELLALNAIVTNQYTCEACALETTSVCEVPIERFEELCETSPGLQYQMMKVMSGEILHHQQLMVLLGKKNAEERMATYLLNLSQRFARRHYSPFQFNLSMSRTDIGNYLGLAEETVVRILARFHDEGLIILRRRQVQISDAARLQATANTKPLLS
jgi:CRP/FNR family transcriptional regulator